MRSEACFENLMGFLRDGRMLDKLQLLYTLSETDICIKQTDMVSCKFTKMATRKTAHLYTEPYVPEYTTNMDRAYKGIEDLRKK